MIGNKALILGVSINSTSANSVLSEIVELASGRAKKCEVGSGKLDNEVRSEKSKDQSISPQYPASHFKFPVIIFTPNPEFIVEAQRDPEFCDLLNKADINLPDGIGLVWAGKVLGERILERVSGADMVEKLLEKLNEKWPASTEASAGKTVGIAGARRGEQSEAEELIKRLQKRYLNINFVNISAGERDPSASSPATAGSVGRDDKNPLSFRAKSSLPDGRQGIPFFRKDMTFNIVFACHGMKKQEKWIWENARPSFVRLCRTSAGAVKANVFMGIGGSLDFLTGFTYRAPVLLRSLGFEWVWRLLQKPSHIKRIWKAVFVFGWLILKEKLRIKN